MSGASALASRLPSLRSQLRKGHLWLVLLSVSLASGLMTVAGVAVLRVYVQSNLQLIARSAGYTVEAALVFHDRAAAAEALALVVQGEDVAQAQVRDAQGRLFAAWSRPDRGSAVRLMAWFPDLLQLPEADLPLTRDGQVIGAVHLRGDGRRLLSYLLAGIGVMLACLALTAVAAIRLSQRLLRSILGPLRTMADVTHAVRHGRGDGRRVPPGRIAELHAFGEDLNALLYEVESRQQLLQKENASLALQARHDPLTGLANRAAFAQALEQGLHRTQAVGLGLAVLYIDCDRFKEINDTWGHEVGDVVLRTVAQRLQACVRVGDVVARLGGDEFAVLLAPLRTADDARPVVDAIRGSMAAPVELPDGLQLQGGLSVGLALYPQDGADAAALLRAADAAMYAAKRRRRQAAAASPSLQES